MPGEKDRIDWRGLALRLAIGRTFGRLFVFVGAGYLAIASFVLVMAWEQGPQRAIEAHRAAPFTIRQDARMVESWVALELDPSRLEGKRNWPGFARVSPCAIVEWEGEWGTARRAFCGTREHLHSEFRLHDLHELSPGVAFDFPRDANGFRVPEIRMTQAALDYLASHPAMSPSGKFTALEEFRRRMDRPVDGAIESWTTKPPTVAIAFEAQHPANAMPAGFVEARRNAEANWIAAPLLAFFGLAFWFAGMSVILIGASPAARIILGALPLLGLPWFAQELPNALRHVDLDMASTVADMLADVEMTSRISATEPADALLRDGARLTFSTGSSLYADTFGKLHFEPPSALLPNGDAALAALVSSTSEQVARSSPADRTALFERLKVDKKQGLLNAGLVFVPSAKQAMLDTRADPAVQRAAQSFLSEWVVQPVLEPDPRQPAFAQTLRIYRLLLDVADPLIANPASWVVERAEEEARKKR